MANEFLIKKGFRIDFNGQPITGVTNSTLTNNPNRIPTENQVKTELDLKTNTSDFNILSGNVNTISSTTNTNTSNLNILSGQTTTNTSNISVLSGQLQTNISNVGVISGNQITISGNLNTVSGSTNTNTLNISSLSGSLNTTISSLNSHTGNTLNPHNTTASQVGAYSTGYTDSAYVFKSGDTMTGTLINPSISATTISAITTSTGINLNSTIFKSQNIQVDSTGKDTTTYSKIGWLSASQPMSYDFDTSNYIRNQSGSAMVLGAFNPILITGAKGSQNFGTNGFGNPSLSARLIVRNINSGGNSILRVDTGLGTGTTQTGNLLEVLKANAMQFNVGASGDTYVGTTSIDPSAKLQVDSTTKGFLPPRMTTTQQNAISTPADGLIIYNTTTLTHQFRQNGAWTSVGLDIESPYLNLTGGTITGNLIVTGTTTSNIISANTISGTTFYGDGSNLSGVRDNILTGITSLDFGNEDSSAVSTINFTGITNQNIKTYIFINTETSATSLDDFSLNGVFFNLENIIDNTSFNIRGTALHNASGLYTIKYIITY